MPQAPNDEPAAPERIKGSSLPVLRIVACDGGAHAFHTELVDTIEQARPLLADASPCSTCAS